jgi:hypothetical protein
MMFSKCGQAILAVHARAPPTCCSASGSKASSPPGVAYHLVFLFKAVPLYPAPDRPRNAPPTRRFRQAIAAYNNTPRKCLDFRTPAEVFSDQSYRMAELARERLWALAQCRRLWLCCCRHQAVTSHFFDRPKRS